MIRIEVGRVLEGDGERREVIIDNDIITVFFDEEGGVAEVGDFVAIKGGNISVNIDEMKAGVLEGTLEDGILNGLIIYKKK